MTMHVAIIIIIAIYDWVCKILMEVLVVVSALFCKSISCKSV